jgi:hypothetical protein
VQQWKHVSFAIDSKQGLLTAPGGLISADKWACAHHFSVGEEPVYLGHLLVETRRHTPDFADLTPAEARAVGLLIACLSHALKACTGAEKVSAVFLWRSGTSPARSSHGSLCRHSSSIYPLEA